VSFWTGFIWLKTEFSGWFVCKWIFSFRKWSRSFLISVAANGCFKNVLDAFLVFHVLTIRQAMSASYISAILGDLHKQLGSWRMSSSGMWCCVDLALTDVSEKCIASIFRVEESASGEPAWAGGCRLSHQSTSVNARSTQRYIRHHLLTLVPRSRIFLPWRWRRYVPPKRRLTQDLHSATSHKMTFFLVTAVKASNRTTRFLFTKYPKLLTLSFLDSNRFLDLFT
jgi:hypothetical protein